jgi:ubiquitin-conjugating enzyme E2 O
VNGVDRTAYVKLLGTGETELVSLLELDRGGSDATMFSSQNSTEALGVQYGDLVLVHRSGTTNGCSKARLPRIGELEPWLREVPENGHCLAWRREMSELGAEVARSRGLSTERLRCKRVAPGEERLFWFGEVTKVRKS